MIEQEGLSLTPYIFIIRNICNTNATYEGNNVVSSAALIESHDRTLNLNEVTTVKNNNNCEDFILNLK